MNGAVPSVGAVAQSVTMTPSSDELCAFSIRNKQHETGRSGEKYVMVPIQNPPAMHPGYTNAIPVSALPTAENPDAGVVVSNVAPVQHAGVRTRNIDPVAPGTDSCPMYTVTMLAGATAISQSESAGSV